MKTKPTRKANKGLILQRGETQKKAVCGTYSTGETYYSSFCYFREPGSKKKRKGQ